MTQLSDLEASLASASAKLDRVDASVQAVAVEVKDLIGRLSQSPVDLSAALASAQAIDSKLSVVQDELGVIPPEPTA